MEVMWGREFPETDPVAVRCEIVLVSYSISPIPAHAYCHYCKTRPGATRDHIVPQSRGGSSAWWNLVPCCQSCNAKKADSGGWCNCAFCARAKMNHIPIVKQKHGGHYP